MCLMYNAPATSSAAAIPEKGASPAQLAAGVLEHPKHPKQLQQSGKDGPFGATDEQELDGGATEIMKSESTLTILIAVAIVFLLFNIVVIVGYLVRRHLGRPGVGGVGVGGVAGGRKVKRKYDDTMLESAAAVVVAGVGLGEKEDGCNQLHGHHHHHHLPHGAYLLDEAATMMLLNTGFSKSVSNVNIVIHRIQHVFQQLSNGLFASK